jgi:AbrB family looped-hinge helix DNA binding protein
MRITVSKKGQIVIPARMLRKVGLQPGDSLDVRVEGEGIILSPREVRARQARIIRDPVTGLPVLTGGPNAPKLMGAEVREILADFP